MLTLNAGWCMEGRGKYLEDVDGALLLQSHFQWEYRRQSQSKFDCQDDEHLKREI